MLITHHPDGEVPFPWPRPYVFTLMVKPENSLESLNAVLRKNLISCIVSRIAFTAISSTPKDWKMSKAMACAIQS
jgi:hypothetical protein